MSKTLILNNTDIVNKIRRIAYQIYEVNVDEKEIIIAGIEKKGYILAKRIVESLKEISQKKIDLCSIKIDKKNPLNPIESSMETEDFKNKSIIVVDDVLNTGTTLMYVVKFFLEVPLRQLKTVVLVDRNHKKYPIKVDFKGVSMSTSIQDSIDVVFSKKGDSAYLE
jgi:pyrimidine operon attenuation protein/uracil phosphoribosyltransferase